MMPTSFIVSATFVFFLFPFEKSGDFSAKKESEIKTNKSVIVNLNLRTYTNNTTGNSDDNKKDLVKTKKTNLVLPSEAFTDPEIEFEDWMKSPKTWKNNMNYKYDTL